MDALMDGCIEGWMYGETEGWMHGCIEGWMYGGMDTMMVLHQVSSFQFFFFQNYS